ncbi:hypothetical protein MMC18_007561 [Xylographa bjoerkii]|nr:hypothetical protein [Xylographa bjoerkii]
MLCEVCKGFDVHSLFALASSRTATETPKLAVHGVYPEFEGFPKFYKHHVGIAALRSSATRGCRLCSIIWQNWAKDRTAEVIEREWLAAGIGEEQIFLGLSKWAPEAQGIPYLTVLQYVSNGTPRTLGMFEVFADRAKVPDGFGHLLAREVYQSPASEECISVAAGWLRDCMTNHKTCLRLLRKISQLPTRVIDVGLAVSSQKPHLLVTSGKCGSWAALSYCWGGNSTFTLKTSNIQDLIRGISLEEFPPTLRDAIVITRSLNIHYLWVDAACILQDSPEDWASEAARMKQVYQGAVVTISAANSPSTYYGIFEERAHLSTCKLGWRCAGNRELTAVYLRSGSHLSDGSMRKSPLNGRGWTLQESLLSPRTLSYGKQQMAWECLECRIDEGGRPVAPGERYRDKAFMQELLAGDSNVVRQKTRKLVQWSISTIPINWAMESKTWTVLPFKWSSKYYEPYDRWFDIVKEYTLRELTVSTDVLPALSGLAAAFEILLADQYCAGLWKNDMIRGLMWNRQKPRQGLSPAPNQQSAPANYRIPSWSWASIRGRLVSFHRLIEDDGWTFTEQAKVLEVGITPRLNDPFGQIREGFLIIRAPFCEIEDPYNSDCNRAATPNPILETKMHDVFANVLDDQSEFQQQHREHAGQRFAVIRIARYLDDRFDEGPGVNGKRPGTKMMVIESTGMQENEFRRVGLHTVQVSNGVDLLNQQYFFKEMEEAKWKWKKVRLV